MMNHTKRRAAAPYEPPLRGLPISGGSWPVNNCKEASIRPITAGPVRRKTFSKNLLPPDGSEGPTAEMLEKLKYLAGAP